MIEFEEKFFEEEIRCGFTVPELMKRTWAAEIKVLVAVLDLCKKYNLKVYPDYGTLLGAVRHKGFIPWDDDIDLVMPRKDYMKLLEVSGELGSGCFIKSIYTRDSFSQFHSVASNIEEEKLTWNQERIEKFFGCPFMVGVDILPLDYSPANPDFKRLQQLVYYVGYSIVHDYDKSPRPDDFNKKLSIFEEKTGRKYDVDSPSFIKEVMIATDSIATMCSKEDSDGIVYFPQTAYLNNAVYFKEEWFEDGEALQFENIDIIIPVGYDNILRLEYGSDYMTPKQVTAAHGYPFYKSQEEYFRLMGYL